LAFDVKNVAKDDDVILLLTEVEFAEIAFEIIESIGNPKLLRVFARHGCDFRIIDGSHARRRNSLRKRYRPCGGTGRDIQHTLDLLQLRLRKLLDERARTSVGQREDGFNQSRKEFASFRTID